MFRLSVPEARLNTTGETILYNISLQKARSCRPEAGACFSVVVALLFFFCAFVCWTRQVASTTAKLHLMAICMLFVLLINFGEKYRRPSYQSGRTNCTEKLLLISEFKGKLPTVPEKDIRHFIPYFQSDQKNLTCSILKQLFNQVTLLKIKRLIV